MNCILSNGLIIWNSKTRKGKWLHLEVRNYLLYSEKFDPMMYSLVHVVTLNMIVKEEKREWLDTVVETKFDPLDKKKNILNINHKIYN